MTAGDLLTLPELRDYAAWLSALTLAVAVVVIGGRQLGLAVLMHEASHWLLFPGQTANNRVGTWLCAAPVCAGLPSYRRPHHLHHRHTRQPADPDLALTTALPRARRALWWGVARDLSGWTAAHALLLAKGHGAHMETAAGYLDVVRRAGRPSAG